MYHPDKLDSGSKELETFKAIQKAHDILSDEEKRKQYDSTDNFDESIPTGKEPPEQFYKVYGEVFERNARWSVSRDVPKLGDDSTDIKQVYAFYDWWYKSFQSWRSFPDEEEYDLSQAESKEEKRWMKVQNEKRKKKLRNEEHARIVKLIDLAYKRDPRIAKHVREEEEEKERAKREKKEQAKQRKKKEEEERQKQAEEEERKKREMGEEERKKKREQENKLKQLQQTFRKMLENDCQVKRETIELLCLSLNAHQFSQLLETLQQDFPEGINQVNKSADEIRERRQKAEEEEQKKSLSNSLFIFSLLITPILFFFPNSSFLQKRRRKIKTKGGRR